MKTRLDFLFQEVATSSFGSLTCRNLSSVFWVMCYICLSKISDCVSKRIQLIWILGVQELSCYVSGDLSGAFTCCSPKVMCLNQVGGARRGGRQEQV